MGVDRCENVGGGQKQIYILLMLGKLY